MEFIGDYHCKTHNTTEEEYRKQYGKVIDNKLYLPKKKSKAETEYISYVMDSIERQRRRKNKSWKLK